MNIKAGVITDDINLLAKTCKLSLNNQGLVTKPIAEVAFTQDTETLSVTSVRPYGSQVTLRASYNSIPSYEILTANIEFMDDLTDADRYDFELDLSQMPIGHPHRKKVSHIFNSFQTFVDTTIADPNSLTLTNHDVIEKVASLAGIRVGRNDLPVVRVLGTLEIIRQTCIQVAKMFCEPFNLFEFQNYFVRCDQNGLQIIKVSYLDPVTGGPAYIISKAEKVQKSYEMYMPENRVGDDDRYLIGATIPGIAVISNLKTPGIEATLLETKTERRVIHTTISTSTLNEGLNAVPSAPDGNDKTHFDQWTETDTRLVLTVDITYTPEVSLPPNASLEKLIELQSTAMRQSEGQPQASGVISVNVAAQRTEGIVERRYDSVNGLLSKQTTEFDYIDMFFRESSIAGTTISKTVLRSSVTIEYLYPNHEELPISKSSKRYKYSQAGELSNTLTYNYLAMRGQWYLQNVLHDPNYNLDFRRLSYLVFGQDIRGLNTDPYVGTTRVDRNGNEIIATDTPNQNSVWVQVVPPTEATTQQTESKIPMSTYQLFDGQPFSFYNDQLLGIYSDKGLTLDTFNTKLAFTVTIPYMDYEGLRLIDDLILQQKALEKQNPYWETVVVETTADYTPVAGMPLVAYGAAGICEHVEHMITPDAVTTKIRLRRLVLVDRSAILNG